MVEQSERVAGSVELVEMHFEVASFWIAEGKDDDGDDVSVYPDQRWEGSLMSHFPRYRP